MGELFFFQFLYYEQLNEEENRLQLPFSPYRNDNNPLLTTLL